MNIKKYIKLVPLFFLAVFAVSVASAPDSSALKCPDGQVLHVDNLCWNETREAKDSNGNPVPGSCDSGKYSKVNNRCNEYAGPPIRDDGSAVDRANLDCGGGDWIAHDDGKCWKMKYTEYPSYKDQASCRNAGLEWHDDGKCWKATSQYETKEPNSYKISNDDKAADAAAKKKQEEDDCKKKQGGTMQNGKCNVTPQSCENAGGSWDDKNKKCNNIPNPSSNAGGQSGGYTATTTQCGDARVNIPICGKSCEAGIDCLGSVLKIIVGVLTAAVGIIAVGGIAYAAVIYASAEDNAGQVSKAKGIIRDVIIGLLLYGFMVAIIGWLVPGSVIG